MPSIQNTIIEFNFTLLSGRIYKNKAKSAGKHHVRYSYSPLLEAHIILCFLSECQFTIRILYDVSRSINR
jgi:hypothetical protein